MKPENQRLTGPQIEGFVKLIGLTRDREFDCGECLQHVSEFAERQLAGQPIDAALACVEHHISVCPECREEYLALMKILETSR